MTALYFVTISSLEVPSAIASLRCKHLLLSKVLAWFSSCEVNENERSVAGGFAPDSGDTDMTKLAVQQKLKQE
jgi:hypothetical protein